MRVASRGTRRQQKGGLKTMRNGIKMQSNNQIEIESMHSNDQIIMFAIYERAHISPCGGR